MKKAIISFFVLLFISSGLYSQTLGINLPGHTNIVRTSYSNTLNHATSSITKGIVGKTLPNSGGNVSWSSNIKGDVGEAIVQRMLVRAVDGRQNWRMVTPRNKPQGLDHIAVRWEKGQPTSILVAETKVNTSQLHSTQYGQQMSNEWINHHLKDLSKNYGQASRAEIVQINSKIPKNAIVCETNIGNPKTGQTEKLWSNDGGKTWNYTGNDSDIELAKKQCQAQSQLFKGGANGQIDIKKRLYRVDLNNKKIIVTNVDGKGQIITETTKEYGLDTKLFEKDIRKLYENRLIENENMSPHEAKILSKLGKVENIANGNISAKKLVFLNVTYQVGTVVVAGLTAAAIDLLMQTITGGFSNINWKQVGTAGLIGSGIQLITVIANCFKIALLQSFANFIPWVGVVVNLVCLWRNYKNGLCSLKAMCIMMGSVVIASAVMWAGIKLGAKIGTCIGGGIGAGVGIILGIGIGWITGRIIYKVEFSRQLEFIEGLRNENSLENQTMRRKYYCNPKLKVC